MKNIGMITPDLIRKLDPQDMRGKIRGFFEQVQEAVAIGKNFEPGREAKGISNIVLAGMGGSAIGGDLLKTYLGGDLKIPFAVNRHYRLPSYVDANSLVIVSSYSGYTEETLEAYNRAVEQKAAVLCITSGGEVAKRAKEHKHPVIFIPGGLQPRAALGYAFFPLLYAMERMGFVDGRETEVEETIVVLKTIAGEALDITEQNLPYRVASALRGKVVIVWSSSDLLQPVGLRWACQIEENGKQLSYANSFPELNHNEIVGWVNPADVMKRFGIVLLRDPDDHPRVLQRMAITTEVLANTPDSILELSPRGQSRLARMFSLIHTGDWVSYFLAMLNGVDPTPVDRIGYLKDRLERTR